MIALLTRSSRLWGFVSAKIIGKPPYFPGYFGAFGPPYHVVCGALLCTITLQYPREDTLSVPITVSFYTD